MKGELIGEATVLSSALTVFFLGLGNADDKKDYMIELDTRKIQDEKHGWVYNDQDFILLVCACVMCLLMVQVSQPRLRGY